MHILSKLTCRCAIHMYMYIYNVHNYYGVSIQEYGMTKGEKITMAEIICNPLLRKMHSDLSHVLSNEISDINHRLDPRLSKHIVISPSRHVRTRLYFTSESHIHCMINILRYGGLFGVSCTATCTCVQLCTCSSNIHLTVL